MIRDLDVLIAEDDRFALRNLHEYISNFGHNVIAEVDSGTDLIDAVRKYKPNLVITDIILEGLDGLSAIQIYSQNHQCANIVVSGCDDDGTLERASLCPVQAYILKPVSAANLSTAIPIALRRFEDLQRLQSEADVARRRLADRSLIDKAKIALMRRAQISEEVAYKRIRTLARNSGQTMGQIANGLLLTEAALSEFQGIRDNDQSKVLAAHARDPFE